jgi:YHS domain-containing protein
MSLRRSAISKVDLLIVFALVIFVGVGTALYVGRNRGTDTATSNPPPPAPSPLSEEDRQLIEKQKVCPVSGGKLGDMGDPYRTEVEGRTVFVCCPSCTGALKKDPAKYLEKLKKE